MAAIDSDRDPRTPEKSASGSTTNPSDPKLDTVDIPDQPPSGNTERVTDELGLEALNLPRIDRLPRSSSLALGPDLHFETLSLRESVELRPVQTQHILELYHQKFITVFSNPDDRSSFAECFHYLVGETHFDIRVALINDQIVGGSHWWLLDCKNFNIGFEEHIWIDKEYRGLKIGNLLYQTIVDDMQALGADGIMGELKDPHMMNEAQRRIPTSGMDPVERVQFWKAKGRMAIDAPYIQPALREGAQPVSDLMLTVKSFKDSFESFKRQEYLRLVESYYSAILGLEDVSSNPTFQRMRLLTARMETIGLVPVDEPRSFITGSRPG